MTQEEPDGSGAPEESMAALLDAETTAYPELRRGEIIEGTVVGTDRDGVLIDIGAKSEGVVPPSEMHCLQPEGASKLNNGDKALVFVLQPESPEGQIILSMDRARGERGWRVLQDYLDENESFEGYVTGSNKGGLLVNVEGINAFVPLSQIVAGPARGSPENTQRALAEWVGRTVTLKVIELNRRRNRAILSERAAVQEKRAAEKERLLKELTEGEVKEGRITSIRDFGIFVDIGGADGLVHLSELSWERTPRSPHEMFKVGDAVPVYVLKIDAEAKKIALSVRRAQPERWLEIVSQFREGQVVPGQVTKLAPFGAFVRLEGPIEGLVHISELVERRIGHPNEVVREGDVLPVKIVRIEYDRHRLGLSLKQARSSAEQDGWTFSERGGAIEAPKDALDRLGLAAMPNQDGTAVADEPAPAAAPEATEETATETAEASAPEGAEPEATEEPAAEAAEPEATEEPAPEAAEAEATEEPAAEPESTEEPAAEAAEAEATEEPAPESSEPESTEESAAEAAEPESTEEPAAEAAEPEEPAAEAAEPDATEEPDAESAEPEATEEPAAEAAEPEESAAEAAEPEATEEPAAEAAEAEATGEPAAESAEPEATEETTAEAAEPDATEEPDAESAEPEATEEPAAESTETEATEEPVAESAETEATEEPAAAAEEDGDNASASGEGAEVDTEDSSSGVTEQSSDAFNKAE